MKFKIQDIIKWGDEYFHHLTPKYRILSVLAALPKGYQISWFNL